MLSYWKIKETIIDEQGWLHTGDQAELDEQGRIYIIGRTREIIVLSSGEKVPPEDLQLAIATDPLFEQVLAEEIEARYRQNGNRTAERSR